MALTSLIGGIALANAKLGAVHGFAGPLGGMYGGPHGALCAALLPHVMATNVAALRERAPGSEVLHRYDVVARLVTGEARACAEDGVRWISELALELAIPPLARYGVKAQDFGDIADKAAISSSMQGNPIVLTRAELEQVLSSAL
jgi:alcohol dehydrogenase class IV